MCGRFVLASDRQELVEHFGPEPPPDLTARYNVAPSQLVALVAPKADPTKRGLALLKWGLVPYWSHDGRPYINARCETVGGLASFSDAFRNRRCIIPATGFYEWGGRGQEARHHPLLAEVVGAAPSLVAVVAELERRGDVADLQLDRLLLLLVVGGWRTGRGEQPRTAPRTDTRTMNGNGRFRITFATAPPAGVASRAVRGSPPPRPGRA
jgi:hypothetical protein